MAEQGSYTIRIAATDSATEKFKRLNAEMRAAQAPARRLAAQMKEFNKLSGFDAQVKARQQFRADIGRIGEQFSMLGRTGANAALKIATMVPILGAITGVATLSGMYRLVETWATWGTNLKNASARLGMTASNLQSYQNAADLAGSSSEAMTTGLKTLSDEMQNAVAGRAPEMAAAFSALGIDIHKNAYEAKSASDVYPILADKIASIKDPTIKAHMAQIFFGGSSEALLPILNKGAAGLEEYRRKAERFGLTSEESVIQADKFREANTGLTLAVQGFGQTIMEKAGPAMTEMVTWISDLIVANKEWIALDVKKWIIDLQHWLQDPSGFTAFKDRVVQFLQDGKQIVDEIGGWKTAFEIWAGLWTLSALLPVLRGISVTVRAIKGITGALELMATAAGAGAISRLLGVLAGPAAWALAFVGAGSSNNPDDQAEVQRQFTANSGRNPQPYQPGQPGTHTTRMVNQNNPPEMRALLDVVHAGEAPNYNTQFGGPDNPDLSHHPNSPHYIPYGAHKGEYSTAFGAFGFTYDTWREYAPKAGVTDMQPANQETTAAYLAVEEYWKHYHRDLLTDLKSKDPKIIGQVFAALSGRWESLKSASVPGPAQQQKIDAYNRALDVENTPPPAPGPRVGAAPPSVPDTPATPPDAGQPAQPNAGSSPTSQVNVHVKFENPPPGMSARTTGTGPALLDAPRTSFAMPLGASP